MSSEPDGGTVRRPEDGGGRGYGDGHEHEPDRDGERESGPGPDPDAADAADAADAVSSTEAVGDGFGSRGWALVAVVVGATLVVPGVIYLLPRLLGNLGLPYVVALLILPMLPAVVLGLTAVWTMRESNHR